MQYKNIIDLSKDIKQNKNKTEGVLPSHAEGGFAQPCRGAGVRGPLEANGTSPRERPTYQPRLLAVRHRNALDCGPRIPWRNQVEKMRL